MWLFQEKQQMAGFWWIIILIIGITIFAVIIPFLFTPEDADKLSTIVLFTAIIDIGVVFLLIYSFRFLHVRADEATLEFGFPPFILKIPYDQIHSAKLTKYTFWQSGGIGIRYGKGRRWNYIAKTGQVIEINWGKKRKHAFSISNHEELSKVLSDFLGEKFSVETQL